MDLSLNNYKALKSSLKKEIVSLVYHDIFDYPLTFGELIKWQAGPLAIQPSNHLVVSHKDGFYFLEGHEGLVYKRLLRKRISERKMEIARRVGMILSFVPTVKLVAVTGALAMGNAANESDIDLAIVTGNGALWTTRLISYLLLIVCRLPLRRPREKDQKDKVCLNMWLSENYLTWPKKDRNVYTAHEISQIVPLVNKDKTYEKFIWKNKWTLSFWPNAVKITEEPKNLRTKEFFGSLIENLAFQLQYRYMKPEITKEKVSKTRALFHPNDWGKIVLSRLGI